MTLGDLFVIAVGLSMDAFAVSICKGLSVGKVQIKHAVIAGCYFGGFQAGMPLVGYFLGKNFQSLIENINHWIAFVLLSLIGANMIRGAFIKEDEEACTQNDDAFRFKIMLPMAIATSIDALAVGATFAVLKVSIVPAVTFIGVTTFTLSAVGIMAGNSVGTKIQSKAELAGGVILILMGIKILLEHTGWLDKLF